MSTTKHHQINRSAQKAILTTEGNRDGGVEVLSPLAAIEAVRSEVASWEGVTTHEHRFGGMEFRVLPDSGWVTAPMRTVSEIAGVIELFRQNYERALLARR